MASGTAEPPKVGDVVMKDGSFKKASEITLAEKDDAVAVVYKVAGGKAWAVGKKHKTNTKWSTTDARANDFSIPLLVTLYYGTEGNYTFEGYLDGSIGERQLKKYLEYKRVTINMDFTADKYPAWFFCLEYGKNQSLPAPMQNGWYFPSVAELFEISKVKTTVDASLNTISGDAFDRNTYWSSSQGTTDDGTTAELFGFSQNKIEMYPKKDSMSVRAVRVFTY